MKAGKASWLILAAGLFMQILSTQLNAQDSYPEDGWWWDAAASGRGYFIERQKDHIFIAAFIYTDEGVPEWLSSDGVYTPANDDPDSIGSYTGIVYRASNGQCIGCEYIPPTVVESEQSPLNITFSDNQNGVLEWFGESIRRRLENQLDAAAQRVPAPEEAVKLVLEQAEAICSDIVE